MNKYFKTKLFLNGDEITFVIVPVSEKDRFETLVRKLGSYAKRFNNELSYSTEYVEESMQ